MNCSAGKIGTISKGSARANGLSTPPIGCVLHLPGLPGGGSKIYDRSPYGSVGTITGASWTRLPSGLWVLDFDGTDDYVNCGSDPSLDLANLTIIAWIKTTSTGTTQTIFSNTSAPTYPGFIFSGGYPAAGRLQFYTQSSGWTANTETVNDGSWHQVVVTSDGTTIFFIDGGSVYSVAQAVANTNSGNPKYMGQYGGSNYWSGNIALLRVYNRALSALEIRNHFNRERHLFGVW